MLHDLPMVANKLRYRRGGIPVWSKYSDAQRVISLHVYHHHERNHQGKENLLLFPASNQLLQSERKVRSRERFGGLLRFYHREAA